MIEDELRDHIYALLASSGPDLLCFGFFGAHTSFRALLGHNTCGINLFASNLSRAHAPWHSIVGTEGREEERKDERAQHFRASFHSHSLAVEILL